MGRPTVVTSDALEGIAAQPGRDLFLADGAEGFAAACLEAAGPKGPEMGAAARARVLADYAWPSLLTRFDGLLNEGGKAGML